MAEPFGDQNENMGPKRPAPTIEGTATEVLIEPASVDDVGGDPAEAEADLGPPEAKPSARRAPPRTSALEFKSFLTHLAAGLLGGLVGVLALAFAWNKLPIRTAERPDVSALERRLGKLEAAPAPAPAGDTEALGQLDARLRTLESRKVEAPPDLSGLTARVTRLEQSLDALAEASKDGGSAVDAAATDAKLGDIEQRLQAKIDAALGKQETATSDRLDSVQTAVATLAAKLGALAEARLSGDDSGPSPELAALDQRIAKLEAALPDLSSTIGQGAASAKSGAAAIAFANLREAVGAGRPYAVELAALRSLAPSIGDLGVLPARAKTGIPTIPELARAYQKVAEASLAAPASSTDESFLDSVIASAKSAVKIRRIDVGETGDTPGAVLTRAEAHLKQGDLPAAMKEVEALPAPSHDAFASWLEDARARVSADATLSTLQGALLTSMGGAPGEAKP
jgi:hypothetical protein